LFAFFARLVQSSRTRSRPSAGLAEFVSLKLLNFRWDRVLAKSSIELSGEAVLAADLSVSTFIGLEFLPMGGLEDVAGVVGYDLSRLQCMSKQVAAAFLGSHQPR